MNIAFGKNCRTDKPRKLRVYTYINTWGVQVYLLQAKYFLFWMDNYQTTNSPKKLLWSVRGLGMRLTDLSFKTDGKVKIPTRIFEECQEALDYFPFTKPQERRL